MKAKIEQKTPQQAKMAKQRLESCLKSATKEQLAAALCTVGENIVAMTSECPDSSTTTWLSAEVVTHLLGKNGTDVGTSPKREALNRVHLRHSEDEGYDPEDYPDAEDQVSSIAVIFGTPRGGLFEADQTRRMRKIRGMLRNS